MSEHALAATANGRSVTIQWGLVNLPVALHNSVAEHKAVPARSRYAKHGDQYHKTYGVTYDSLTDAPVNKDDTVMVVELADHVVEIDDDEIEAATADPNLPKGTARIEKFVPMTAIGTTYVVEGELYWRPQMRRSGRNKVVDPAAERAFGLLCAAMAERQVAALIRIMQYRAPRWMALLPDGRAVQLAFALGARQAPVMPVASHTKAEMAMAMELIDKVGTDEPVLVDDAGGRLDAYIAAKESGRKVELAPVPEAAPVVDLMAALSASVAAAGPARKAPAKKVAARTRKAS